MLSSLVQKGDKSKLLSINGCFYLAYLFCHSLVTIATILQIVIHIITQQPITVSLLDADVFRMIADLERELSDRKSQSGVNGMTTVNPPAEIPDDMFTVNRENDDQSSDFQRQFRLILLSFIYFSMY